MMGGSWALALKKNGFAGERVGWDRPEVLERARARGAIDRAAASVAEAVRDADLIYLALPVLGILDLLPEVGRAARAGALITDAGSTKARICRHAQEHVPAQVHFLGGHPMAGKETGGIENADADLFVGAKYVVIREEESAEEIGEPVAEFLAWVRRAGAEPVWLDAETHDWAVALVSHAPQLVSTALASAVWDETDEDGLPVRLAAGGFRSLIQKAGSPYDIWRDICLTNSGNIGRALERLEQRLKRVRENLRSPELAEEFEKARRTLEALRGSGRNPDE